MRLTDNMANDVAPNRAVIDSIVATNGMDRDNAAQSSRRWCRHRLIQQFSKNHTKSNRPQARLERNIKRGPAPHSEAEKEFGPHQ
jgi:hypothetical protein